MAKLDKADVVIVGGGAAGALMAAKLAAAGKRVVVLEAGPGWEMTDLVSSQVWARRLRWGGAPVLSTGDHPYAHNFNTGWGLGGAALHHYGTWPRLGVDDFKIRSAHGKGLDWPIDYTDLQPYYDRIQEEVGLSGDADAEIWRGPGAPYPMPPLEIFAQARVIEKGFKALGLKTAPAPMAINSVEYKGRPPCIYDGWCDAGCPTGALANPHAIYLPAARAKGAELRVRSTATRVLTDAKGRASAVEYADATGAIRTQPADVVVLAGSVVQNPRLLLNSRSDRFPNGLANGSGLVGKYFMTHTLIVLGAIFREETECWAGVNGAQLTCRDAYGKTSKPGMFGSQQWLVAPAVKPNDLIGIAVNRPDLVGPAVDAFLKRAARGFGNMVGMGEELPRPENRVELAETKDALGMPQARIVHGFDADALAIWGYMKDKGLEILKAAGAEESWSSPTLSAHMMGGTVMGASAKVGVTDSYGRTHEVPNLVIVGPGIFPTAGAVNPTFTLHALGLRTAEHMAAHWADYAG